MKLTKILLLISFLIIFFTLTMYVYATEPEQQNEVPESPSSASSASIIIPLILNQPDSGWMYGFTYIKQNLGSQRDLFQGGLIYTQKEQLVCFTSLKNYLNGGKYLLWSQINYADWPDNFFGIGNEDPKKTGEKYTSNTKQFSTDFLWRIGDSLYFGPTVSFNWFDVYDKTNNGQLAQGNIIGSNGGNAAGIGLHLYQNNLDEGNFPTRGQTCDIILRFYNEAFGSSQEFSQFSTNYSKFLDLDSWGVIGINSRILLSNGDVPFQMMPSLGNSDIMRGIEPDKYCDLNLAAIQGEYRFPIYNRWSGVSFVALGDVADSINALKLDHFTWGFGVRYALDKDQTFKLRLDVGTAKDESAAYFGVQEAF